MADLPTGTVTFLFTDIEGSTRLWERDAQAMQAALARHDEIIRDAMESRGGYVFKTVGDAFCAAFRAAPDAFEAAVGAPRAVLSAPGGAVGRPRGVRLGPGARGAPGGFGAGLAAQRVLFSEPWGKIGSLRVRMALHTG